MNKIFTLRRIENIKLFIYKSYLFNGIGIFFGWIVGALFNNMFEYMRFLKIFRTLAVIFILGGILLYTLDAIIMLFKSDKTSSHGKEQKLFIIGIISTVSFLALIVLFFVLLLHSDINKADINEDSILIYFLFLALLITNLTTYFKVKIIRSGLISESTY